MPWSTRDLSWAFTKDGAGRLAVDQFSGRRPRTLGKRGPAGRWGDVARRAAGDDGYSQPRAASETGGPSAITKWSSRRTSTNPNACLRLWVTARSAALGSRLPLGWLWPTITAAALCARARRTTSRGCTSVPSIVPVNSSSKASARWRLSRNSAAKTSLTRQLFDDKDFCAELAQRLDEKRKEVYLQAYHIGREK